MQITGKLVQLLPLQTGTGKKGEWKKQDIIIETEGQYPKKVCISVWGDKIDSSQLQTGNQMIIEADIESREFNGKWYTDVKAWKIATGSVSQSSNGIPNAPLPDMPPPDLENDVDLPF
ncbi:MAG: DUF3127 domain-containing protein [Bacteroidetes bacterium]|nr:DUF3127 domain-containing protein [Bacteroidota bacterium]MBU1718219.1 DUF3127 domain-containing protein [Bacteroidota bacterium]